MAKEEIDKLAFEKKLLASGKKIISGTDEVGRGPLAGPVCVASVVMPLEPDKIIAGIDDSKKLPPKRREELYEKIMQTAKAVRIEWVDEKRIDEINILNATKEAMVKSIENLGVMPDIALVDAVKNLPVSCETMPIVKGDALSYSIGAASIVAKVSRDRLMCEMAKKYPEYGFEKNMGYGTAVHMEALRKFGASPIHRKTFLKFMNDPAWLAGGNKSV